MVQSHGSTVIYGRDTL
jgi:hypothetical protein